MIGRSDREFEEAFVELFVRAERVAMRIIGSRTEAEDVAAETMVRALGSWRTMRTYRIPWVTRVAANLAIDIVRRRGVVPAVVSPAEPGDGTDRIVLFSALAGLSRRQRQALVLRHLVGLDLGETARAMDISPATVKTHLERGATAMRAHLGDEFLEPTDAT